MKVELYGSPSRARTALPPAHAQGADEVCGDTVEQVLSLLQEVVELGDELGEVVKCQEASVEGPGGTNTCLEQWLAVCTHCVVLAATQDDVLAYCLLVRVWIGVKVLNGGLRDPVAPYRSRAAPTPLTLSVEIRTEGEDSVYRKLDMRVNECSRARQEGNSRSVQVQSSNTRGCTV